MITVSLEKYFLEVVVSKRKQFFIKLKDPGKLLLPIVYFFTLMAITLAVVMLFVDYVGTPLEILAYISFATAAVSLGYSIYTIIIYAPRVTRWVMAILDSNRLTREMVHNFGFRTVVFAIFTFIMSLAMSAFHVVIAVITRSFWYGALASYYIMLAVLRGRLLVYHKNKRTLTEPDEYVRARKYRTTGYLLLVLNIALTSAIVQMIFDDKAFIYLDWLVYAVAAYTFTKMFMATFNMIKARGHDDLTVRAIRSIGGVDAVVSLLALQTTLLHSFGGASQQNTMVLNAITGSAVGLFVLSLSVFMIIKGNRKVRLFREKYDIK